MASRTPDRYGCATFGLRTAGLTSCSTPPSIGRRTPPDRRLPVARPTSTSATICCDCLLVGHSYFAHLFGAEQIMANTTATLIGSCESVRVMGTTGPMAGCSFRGRGNVDGESIRVENESSSVGGPGAKLGP